MLCPDPAIIAARLTAIRNLSLRQQLCEVAKEVQSQHEKRLPLLNLVTLAVYEEVFNRQVIDRLSVIGSIFNRLAVVIAGRDSKRRSEICP